MKKLLAFLMVICTVISLPITTVFAVNLSHKNTEEQVLTEKVEAYLISVAENMWLYKSNDLTDGTVVEFLNDVPQLQKFIDGNESMPLVGEEFTAQMSKYVDGISFVDNKSEYFKELRQSQDIQRDDFNIEYEVIDIDINHQEGEVRILESISFRYPDFPDTLSEVMSEYSVKLISVDNEWLIADVTAINDWFDDTFKEEGFDAKHPEDSFRTMEAAAEAEYAELESIGGMNLVDAEAGITPAASATYYYNRANAAAYAYTYTTSAYNNVANHSSSQKADARTYWNANFAQYGPDTDCMNFASQSMWAGFNGNNSTSSIASHAAPMDTNGNSKWYGTTRGNESSGDVSSWRSCSYFRTYLANEASSSSPDIYVDRYTLSGSQSFSQYSGITQSNLLGAILHVNSGGHAIVVTDVNGLGRGNVLFTAHTSDRKGVKISEYWNSGTIYVMIPQTIRVNNASDLYLSATLHRPAPVNSTLTLNSGANYICSSLNVSIRTPSGRTATNYASNTSGNKYNYKFTERGLYTITTTAKKTSSSAAQTHVYTVRIY